MPYTSLLTQSYVYDSLSKVGFSSDTGFAVSSCREYETNNGSGTGNPEKGGYGVVHQMSAVWKQ